MNGRTPERDAETRDEWVARVAAAGPVPGPELARQLGALLAPGYGALSDDDAADDDAA